MENGLRGIGEMSRDSGLSVSALRFYDGAGVLVPAWVDPASGYRWYSPEQLGEARLLARLRRAGMPLADIRLVLAGWPGPETGLVRELLRAHLRRLERELSDARAELATVLTLLDRKENAMTSPRNASARLDLPTAELAGALDAVRFAVGTDPGLPMLSGVLFDIQGAGVRVVATDRYRMAVARAGAHGRDGRTAADRGTDGAADPGTDGGAGGREEEVRVLAVVPTALADAMRALLEGDAAVRLSVDAGRVTLEAGDRQVAGRCLGHDFPDYRRLVRLPAGRRVTVDVPALREALETGPVRAGEPRPQDGVPRDVSVLTVTDGGTVAVCEAEDAGDAGDAGEHGGARRDRIAVDRGFLLEALAAGARDELVLELGTPTAPLAIRRPPGEEDSFSLLMPVRLESRAY